MKTCLDHHSMYSWHSYNIGWYLGYTEMLTWVCVKFYNMVGKHITWCLSPGVAKSPGPHRLSELYSCIIILHTVSQHKENLNVRVRHLCVVVLVTGTALPPDEVFDESILCPRRITLGSLPSIKKNLQMGISLCPFFFFFYRNDFKMLFYRLNNITKT